MCHAHIATNLVIIEKSRVLWALEEKALDNFGVISSLLQVNKQLGFRRHSLTALTARQGMSRDEQIQRIKDLCRLSIQNPLMQINATDNWTKRKNTERDGPGMQNQI
jgi:hypothetical protein